MIDKNRDFIYNNWKKSSLATLRKHVKVWDDQRCSQLFFMPKKIYFASCVSNLAKNWYYAFIESSFCKINWNILWNLGKPYQDLM